MTKSLTRRAALASIAAAIPGSALAFDIYELDPADLVPSYYRLHKFLSLDENEIYKVGLAIKRNRRIVIEGYTPSESKAIIKRARKDWPATRAELIRAHGGS